jgi:hypothetical protein
MKAGLESTADEIIGRDPRTISLEELAALGHKKMPLAKVIRLYCLDCSHSDSEVRKCTAVRCGLWPYRMRKNPFSERKGAGNIEALRRFQNRRVEESV